MADEKSQRSLCSLKREFKYRKPICPFICSTFQDFQVERDILVKKVFPTIDALCRERGTFCAPIDLRWGINDHQVSSGQVVNLCLDYVTKCAPFFICLVGERFGSHRPHNGPPLANTYRGLTPDAHWMDRNLVIAASSGHDWVTDEPYRNYSVTALEVAQRGKLAAEGIGDDFSFYYFRQQEHLDQLFPDLPEDERQEKLAPYMSESEHCREECRDLKARIVKRGIPVRYFKSPEELRQLVLDDWIAVVNRLYPPFYQGIPDSHQESLSEWMAHEAFAETRRRVFVRTPELSELFRELTQFALSSLDDPPPQKVTDTANRMTRNMVRSLSYGSFLRNKKLLDEPEQTSVMLMVGQRGCGKSSVIANWFQEFQNDHPEVKVISHHVGCSAHSIDLHALMRRFTHEIRNEYPDFQGSPGTLGNSNNSDVADFHHVCEAFQAALGLGPCVLILDGVDELGETYGKSHNQVKEMTWLPSPLPAQCKVVITSTYSDTTHKALALRDDIHVLHVPLLKDTASKSVVIREYLAIHCKCLDEKQLEHVVNCKLSDRPIFLSVLANELRVYGVYSCLDVYLESYLEATSIRDLWSKIIQRWTKDYGWTKEETTSTNNKDSAGSTGSGSGNSADSDKQELSGWVADALRLLAVSRNGLSRSEILALLEQLGYSGQNTVTTLEWAVFRSAALDSLVERPGGLLTFFHQHFKEAVQHTLLGSATPSMPHDKERVVLEVETFTEEDVAVRDPKKKRAPHRREFHKHIADYFLHKEHSCRRSEELPWQLERAGELDTLAQVLSEPRLFLEMAGDRIMHRKRLELVKYWKNLTEAGHDISVTYWRMLKRAAVNVVPRLSDKIAQLRVCGDHSKVENGGTKTDKLPNRVSLVIAPGQNSLPQILKTCPSDTSSLSSLRDTPSPSEQEVLDSEPDTFQPAPDETDNENRRDSVDSTTSVDTTTSSLTSSGDLSEAFPDGHAKGPRDLARLTMSTGQFLSIMSSFVDAEKMLLTAHEKLGQVSFSAESQRLLCGLEESIGNMYLYQLRKDEADGWYNRALRTVDEHLAVLKSNDSEGHLLEMKGRLLDHLGNMKTYDRKFKEAENLLSRSKACFVKSKCKIGHAIVHYHIGFLRVQQGQFEEAELLFADSLLIIERWFGKNHPRVAEVLNDLATLVSHPDNKHSYDVTQAENIHRRALHIRETCFGPDHLVVATSLFHLGTLMKGFKSYPAQKEARTMLRRALDIRTTKLGHSHGLTKAVRRVLNNLELTLQLRNKPAPDTRSDELPYSLLTCHEQQLSVLKKRADRQAVLRQENSTKSVVWGQPTVLQDRVTKESTSKTEDFLAEHETQSRSDVGTDVSVDDSDNDTDSGESEALSNTSTERTLPDEYTNSHILGSKPSLDTRYLDSFALEIKGNSPITENKRTHSASVRFRPLSAPAMADYDRSQHHFPSSRPQSSRMDVLSHFSTLASSSAKKRLKSAPPSVKYQRRSSTGSTTTSPKGGFHRKSCSVPGSHTVDIHNAHCVMYGPNTSLSSLLGRPEAPRYNVYSRGVQHASAWYHVPGRYATLERPYPPKRLQKRSNQARTSVGGGGQKENTKAPWSDTHNLGPRETLDSQSTNSRVFAPRGNVLVSH